MACPILIKQGQAVMYSIYSTQRDPKYYGKDADVFRPERWFEPETRKWDGHSCHSMVAQEYV